MIKRRLKRPVVYSIYGICVMMLVGSIYLIEGMFNTKSLKDDDTEYVSQTIFDKVEPVVGQTNNIVRPYRDQDVAILKTYYDYMGESESQENSLIYYDGTYLQSSGVSYGKDEVFDVVAIKDGSVVSVKEDNLLGNTVQIKHADDTISVYQSLSDVLVNEGEIVNVGQTIAKSGTSNIEKDLNNHVHFEIIVSGRTVNPEEYFNTSTAE